ncbi:FAD linked oxidase N-terminal [Penicillium samsonianum]|uniref:FAD linked oxidase N-terminal n=1 Tax=Penicillium samsonianum TaxID=1882272 RepID=UPI0025490839|nr:FAD linked oxidase N-terminal [Penicillium samsonianum]KAJ6132906.1 FAD linked oxidase N-terminal [Penicillium samsonianum]
MKLNLVTFFACLPTLFVEASKFGSENVSLTSACRRACSRIASDFNSATSNPGNGNLTVWDAKQQAVKSACRVVPVSTDEVSRVMSIVVEESCHFAVKGGGHARYPDDSVSVGGVTIDMQRMRSIHVSPNQKTVKLGGGHTLHSVYEGLNPHNLTVAGGRAATVGLGGYTLGGGISHLSPIYGLAMDNVFEYELILPNATVVVVTEDAHPDLYFALRGGMNNFGIVTHFIIRAVFQGQIHAGDRTYTIDKRDAILDQAYRLTTQWKNNTAISFSHGFGYHQSTGQYTVSFTPEYSHPILNPAPFAELKRIPFETDTVRLGLASEFSEDVSSATPRGGRNLFATATYYPSSELDKQMQEIMMDEIKSVKWVPGFHPNMIMQPLYEAAIHAGNQRGGNTAGIEADGPLTVVLSTVLWENSADDDAMNRFVSRWVESATSLIHKSGKDHPWLYINYASKDQDPFSGYGETNLQRLRDIQKRVDPSGVFTSTGLCRGYFKLL